MKKNKLLLFLVLVILISLVGCSNDLPTEVIDSISQSTQMNITTKKIEPPTAEEMQAVVLDELQKTLNLSDNQANPLVEAIINHLDIEVVSITPGEKECEKYNVECKIQNYSVQDTFELIIYNHPEMTMDQLVSEFSNYFPNASMIIDYQNISVERINDYYSVHLTDEFIDVALGGFLSYFDMLIEE